MVEMPTIEAATQRLVAVIADVTAHWPVPGGVVVVVDRDGVIAEHEFGWDDLTAETPMRRDRLFEIGSISKVATAAVVHQLIDEGLLALDTSLVEILPWFRVRGEELDDDFGQGERIQVRHLLHHSAGLVASVDAVPDEAAQLWSARETVVGSEAGTFFHYSNLGYLALGLVAEALTGERLVDLVQHRVLDRLGMSASVSAVTHDLRPLLAQGTEPLHDDRPWLPGDPLAPATWLEVAGADGNIAASAADLARFARMLLGRGTLDGVSVLSGAAFDRMTTDLGPGGEDIVALIGSTAPASSRYGLGINVERAVSASGVDHELLTHGGGMVGFASFLLADLTSGQGIAVLTNANGDSPIAEVIARAAAAVFASPTAAVPALDPARWRTESLDREARPRAIEPAMLGAFRATRLGQTVELTMSDGSGGLILASAGVSAPVFWGWGDRLATSHPHFRRFHLNFVGGQDGPKWIWGELVFRQGESTRTADQGSADQGSHPDLAALCGRYRSYSPWFTSFRLVDREGQLVLIAATGVEAPGEDMPLVEVAPGLFRIGDDPRLPERLRVGPIVDGRAIWVDRDSCRYSRAFTD